MSDFYIPLELSEEQLIVLEDSIGQYSVDSSKKGDEKIVKICVELLETIMEYS